MRRWVFPSLMLAGVVAAVMASQLTRTERGPWERCLTSAECLKGEQCAVIPADDGFATMGTCTVGCSEAQACLNGWVCAPFVEVGGYLVPPGRRGSKAAVGPPRSLCVPSAN